MKPKEHVWAHATNTEEKLTVALNDAQVTAVEADVIVGSDGEPVMGHPPSTVGTMTVRRFLALVTAQFQIRIVKLDFKSNAAFLAASPTIQTHLAAFNPHKQQLWINADIVAGPGGCTPAFDAPVFVAMAAALAFPKSKPESTHSQIVLSLGWTTGSSQLNDHGFPITLPASNSDYSVQMVSQMLDAIGIAMPSITAHRIPITFAVRAPSVLSSWPALQTLLQLSSECASEFPLVSLTLWWNKAALPSAIYARIIKMLEEEGSGLENRTFYDLQ
ncbi:hypothetical protein HK100_011454 [Physocladia obscura]|uniref:Menorin-like domain-containing protein n=1 Tax=Physocladia obscura TaxID=109957 RepID=A0AAD5XD81_9FUNG|nr:hypothetical protein HK100_011454 [Physocladia obscura]